MRIQRAHAYRRRQSGFTLLEILLAMAVASLLMTGVLSFVFSMGELWRSRAPSRNTEMHARQLTDMLRTSFGQALSAEGQNRIYVFWDKPSADAFRREPLLTWETLESSSLLVWPETPLPFVIQHLEWVQDEGLYLLWQSRLEIDFEETAPRRTLLSSWVQGLEYEYRDPETGVVERLNQPKAHSDNTYIIPDTLFVLFEADGQEWEQAIPIPGSAEGRGVF